MTNDGLKRVYEDMCDVDFMPKEKTLKIVKNVKKFGTKRLLKIAKKQLNSKQILAS